jgi:hypothetical protein
MTVSESALLPQETVRAVSAPVRARAESPAPAAASERPISVDELADAIERTFRPEHVFVAAANSGPLVDSLWRRAMRATAKHDPATPAAYDLAVVDPANLEALSAVAARTEIVLFVDDRQESQPGASLLTAIEWFAERSFDLDPIAELPIGHARALVFRRVARPLPPAVRRAYASLLHRTAGVPARDEALAALRERNAALEREAGHARTMADVERSDRLRTEADLARVAAALEEANDALSEQLEAARAARAALDRDIETLAASPLWRLKLAVGRRLRRTTAR